MGILDAKAIRKPTSNKRLNYCMHTGQCSSPWFIEEHAVH